MSGRELGQTENTERTTDAERCARSAAETGGHMGRRATLAIGTALISALPVGLGACGPMPNRPEPERSTTSAPPSEAGDTRVREHESGPESPIAYGFRVPAGASQVGPLIRSRSERLIEAYRPELEAAEARRDADLQRRRDEREAQGSPLPPPQPTPEPTEQPTEDTFGRLKAPPKPDTTISVMRIDGQPTAVVRAMLAQIDVILPKAGIIRSDLRKYCESERRRVVRCHVEAAGRTPAGRTVAVTMHVDPGNFRTRTAPPATNQRPVMYLKVAYIGDPREGQANRRGDSSIEVPAGVQGRDPSNFIWPKMDLDASPSSRLLNGWRAPLQRADLLLSGYTPAFAVLSATKAADASAIARQFALNVNENADVDVVEDLNEITTTYTATAPDGGRATASYILSARGYYAVLLYEPPAAPAPVTPAPTTIGFTTQR